MELGKRIRKRREELNISQDVLAKRLGYKSRSSINKIELGLNDITQSRIVAIAKALDTTPGYLMGWEDDFDSTPTPTECDEIIINHVAMFSKLSPTGKEKVVDYTELVYNSEKDK